MWKLLEDYRGCGGSIRVVLPAKLLMVYHELPSVIHLEQALIISN